MIFKIINVLLIFCYYFPWERAVRGPSLDRNCIPFTQEFFVRLVAIGTLVPEKKTKIRKFYEETTTTTTDHFRIKNLTSVQHSALVKCKMLEIFLYTKLIFMCWKIKSYILISLIAQSLHFNQQISPLHASL